MGHQHWRYRVGLLGRPAWPSPVDVGFTSTSSGSAAASATASTIVGSGATSPCRSQPRSSSTPTGWRGCWKTPRANRRRRISHRVLCDGASGPPLRPLGTPGFAGHPVSVARAGCPHCVSLFRPSATFSNSLWSRPAGSRRKPPEPPSALSHLAFTADELARIGQVLAEGQRRHWELMVTTVPT